MCSIMWPLAFIWMSAVVGVPINQTQEATSHAPDNVTVPAMLGVQQLATAAHLKVPLNSTQNATSLAPGLDLPQQSSPETFQELQEDMTIKEGDILIPEDRNAVETVWADGIVPYSISDGLANRASSIYNALKMISDATCVRFQQHTTELNYLEFVDGNGCASFIGCRGGAQQVYFSRVCSVGNLCHEIIHALGLHHEHTRSDRDKYITVQWKSITEGKQGNFMMKSGNTLNLPYDLNSIMHYGKYFFSVDGNPTMLPKQEAPQMGQRTQLSPLDIQKLNKLYHCDEQKQGSGAE